MIMEGSTAGSLPATELEYELKQALKNKDHCMLDLSMYFKSGEEHATGIYQEKAGGPILFYDPEGFIKTVKDVQDIVKKIIKNNIVESDDEKTNVIVISSDPDTWRSWNKEFIIIPKIGQNE